jgi:hypothetical protein
MSQHPEVTGRALGACYKDKLYTWSMAGACYKDRLYVPGVWLGRDPGHTGPQGHTTRSMCLSQG